VKWRERQKVRTLGSRLADRLPAPRRSAAGSSAVADVSNAATVSSAVADS